MLTCQETARLVSKGLDTRLTLRERWQVRLHLRLCDACRSYRAQLRRLREILRRGLGAWEALATESLTPEERDALERAVGAASSASR